MVPDWRYRLIRRFVGPHGVGRAIAAERDAEIGAIPLVRAVGGMLGPFQEHHVDVLAGNILYRGIARFPQEQRLARVRDDASCDPDDDPCRVWWDRYWMIRSRDLDRLGQHSADLVH